MAFLATTIGIAAENHNFQTAKLLDIDTTVKERWANDRYAQFTIQVGDLVYTARGARVKYSQGDLGQGLIVGDPVQVAIQGKDLLLVKPNGKEMKTTIMKRARAQAAQ